MDAPLVSLIIPVYNKLIHTRACLEALRGVAPFDPRYELIIVDDGSSDDTPTYLRSLDGGATVRRHSGNRGFAAACNTGALQANGEFLVFLNNDTIPHQGWLTALLEPIRADPSVGAVGCKLLYPTGAVQHAGVAFVGTADHPILPFHIYRGARADAPYVNRAREFRAVSAACMAVRRDLFLDIGGFDEAYVNGYEDVDFCLRVGERDLRICYTPASVLIHHESQTRDYREGEANLDLLNSRWSARISPDYRRYLTEDRTKAWEVTALSVGSHYASGRVEEGDAEFVTLLQEIPARDTAIFKQFRCYRHLERVEPILTAAVCRVLSSPEVPAWARGRHRAFQAELLLTLAQRHYSAGRPGRAWGLVMRALGARPTMAPRVLWLLTRFLVQARLLPRTRRMRTWPKRAGELIEQRSGRPGQ